MPRQRALPALVLALLVVSCLALHPPGALAEAQEEGGNGVLRVSRYADLAAFFDSPDMGIHTIELTGDILCTDPGGGLLSIVLFQPLTIAGNGHSLRDAALSVVTMGGALRIEDLAIHLNYQDGIGLRSINAPLMAEWGEAELWNVTLSSSGGEHVGLHGIAVRNGAAVRAKDSGFTGASIRSGYQAAGNGLHVEGAYTDLGGNACVGGDNAGSGGAGSGVYASQNISLRDCSVQSGGGSAALLLNGANAALENVRLQAKGAAAIQTTLRTDSVAFTGTRNESSWPLLSDESIQVSGLADDLSLAGPQTLTEGESRAPVVTWTPPDTTLIARWTSADPSILEITPDGSFLGVSPGDCEVVATLPSGTQKRFAVTVAAKQTQAPDPSAPGAGSGGVSPVLPTADLSLPQLAPPEPFKPGTSTADFYVFREDAQVFSAPGGSVAGDGVTGDFAIPLDGDKGGALRSFVQIAWEGGSGYVAAEMLERVSCTVEYASQPAAFIETADLYDRPGGEVVGTVAPGIPVSSLITGGSWTAVAHNGGVAFASARSLRLLPMERTTATTTVKTPLYLEPDSGAPAVTTLWEGVRVMFLRDEEGSGWTRVKLGALYGYVRSDHLVLPVADPSFAQ